MKDDKLKTIANSSLSKITTTALGRSPIFAPPHVAPHPGTPDNDVNAPYEGEEFEDVFTPEVNPAYSTFVDAPVPTRTERRAARRQARAARRQARIDRRQRRAARIAARRRNVLDAGVVIPNWGTALPSTWTLNKTWDVGGAGTNDMSAMFVDTHKHLSGFDMSPDGLFMIIYSGANDSSRTWNLDIAYDLENVVTTGWKGDANHQSVPVYHKDFFGYSTCTAVGTFHSIRQNAINNMQTARNVSSSDVTAASMGDTDTGTAGKHDWNADGSAFYVNVYNGQAHFRRYEVATPYDFTDMVSDNNVTTVQYPAVLRFQQAQVGNIRVSPDEKYVIIQDTSTIFLGTMATPGDASTMVVDEVNTLTVSPASASDGIAFNSDFTQAYIGRTGGLTDSYIDVYDTNI